MLKARKLKSGKWNVRVTVCGQSYSFTHPNRKTAIRLAAAFAEEVCLCRRGQGEYSQSAPYRCDCPLYRQGFRNALSGHCARLQEHRAHPAQEAPGALPEAHSSPHRQRYSEHHRPARQEDREELPRSDPARRGAQVQCLTPFREAEGDRAAL